MGETSRTVQAHFTITGAFVTQHARKLWAEGHAAEALRFLMEDMEGMTEEIALLICTGKKKLVGKNAEIGLEDDKATTDSRDIPLPSAIEVFMRKDFKTKEAERDLNVVLGISRDVEEAWGVTPVGKMPRIQMQTIWDRKKPTPEEQQQANLILDGMIQEMIDRTSPEAKENPEPDIELEAESGWLSPEGDFFPCHYRGHITLANRLGDGEFALESSGWLKLSARRWYRSDYEKPVTQKQFDSIVEWCTKHKAKMEDWIKTD
jgi:hypothetical protein